MSILRLAGLAVVSILLAGETSPPTYAVGQVWAYQTRPRDAGSLLKIQQTGDLPGGKVYHVSIVGVHFATPGIAGTLPHIPVSAATLDASVTRLAPARTDFPATAVQDGIAEWQRANGGVFTIPVSQIIDIIDHRVGQATGATGAQSTGS